MGSFGLTLDKGNELSNKELKELKVLTVYPFSVANMLKLASGDVIVNLDGKVDSTALDSPNNKLKHYINSLNVGDKIEITVMRDNEEHLLIGDYQPTILPESHYRIMPNINVVKPTLNSCASISRYFTGIKGYKIIAHNGELIKDIFSDSNPLSLKLSSGVHRFKEIFSPTRIGSISLNERRFITPYDIAPRISGGSRAGDNGIKNLMVTRTGSINGWFSDSRTKGFGTNPYVINSIKGRPPLNITINVEQNNKYKFKVEQEFSNTGQSTHEVTSKAKPDDLDYKENVLAAVLPLLSVGESIVENHQLTKTLQFELDQLLLEMKNFYIKNEIIQGVIDIYRERKVTHKYGVIGKMVGFDDNYALLIKQITVIVWLVMRA